MNYIALAAILVSSVYVTARYGPARTFTIVVLPVMLFLVMTMSYKLPGIPLPALEPVSCITYGTILGLFIGRKFPDIRLHPLDYLVVLMAISPAISGWINVEFWTFINQFALQLFWWVTPYFMGRVALKDPAERQRALTFLCFATPVIGFLGLLEWRLFPNEVLRFTDRLNLTAAYNEMVLRRWQFFRSIVTFFHPIDHGNMGVLTGSLILILAYMQGLTIFNRRVQIALAGSALSVLTSMSFTSFVAAILAAALVTLFFFAPRMRWSLVVFAFVAVAGMVYLTGTLLGKVLNENDRINADALGDSVWIRALIVQRAWEKAKIAGFFGFERSLGQEELELESVDNSYLLFIIRYGWLYLAAWGVLLMSIVVIGYRMLGKSAQLPERARGPVAMALATLLAVMCGMYTVWFGFTYAYFFMIVLGMFITMRQMLRYYPVAPLAHSTRRFQRPSAFPVDPPRLRPRRQVPPEPVESTPVT